MRCAQRRRQCRVIPPADACGRPALSAEPGLRSAGPAVRRARIVDDYDGQPVQAYGTRERDRLMVRALVELPVSDQNEYASVLQAPRAEPERDAYADGQAVTKRAAGDLYAV